MEFLSPCHLTRRLVLSLSLSLPSTIWDLMGRGILFGAEFHIPNERLVHNSYSLYLGRGYANSAMLGAIMLTCMYIDGSCTNHVVLGV